MARRTSRGMVTVELAMGLLAAALAVATACWVVSLVVLHARCLEVATEVARQVARADTARANDARSRAPEGCRRTEQRPKGQVVVQLDCQRWLGPVGPVLVGASATADVEPGVQP